MTMSAVIASIVAGAVAGTSTVAWSAEEDITIGVAMRTQTQPRWRFDVASMEEKAKELGAKLLVQWANDDPVVSRRKLKTC
jgi:ABC-type xylose transport system substrate-binding protein